MIRAIITALFLYFSQIAIAQISIVGRVIDAEDKSPIEFATVAVFSAKDTIVVDGVTTSGDGRFILNQVSEGKFILRVSFVGYIAFYKNIEITNDNESFEIDDIRLTKGVMLDEFQISEMLVPVLVRGDTVEFAADAFRPTEGSMLAELLKRLPSVEIDREGKITFNGREVRQILVDGEEFFSTNPQVAARNIPADFVQRVQAFLKQSDEARFTGIEDGNEQMVINIILRPEIRMGWFGRVRLGAGVDNSNNFRYANSANINSFSGRNRLMILGNFNNAGRDGGDSDWVQLEDGSGDHFRIGGGWTGLSTLISPMANFVKRIGDKWSFSGSYRYSNDDERHEEHSLTENFLPTGSQFSRTERSIRSLNQQHSFNTEIRYTPNERNELIIRPNFSFVSRSGSRNTIFDLKDDTLGMINQGTTQNPFEYSGTTARLHLSYGHRFAKPQRTLRVNFDGMLYNGNDRWYMHTIRHFAVLPSDTTNLHVISLSNRHNFGAGVIYTEPLAENFILSLTYRLSNNESRSERDQYNFNSNTNEFDLLDTAFSNDFGNSFFQQTLSAQIQRTMERHTYSLGFNLTQSKTLSFIEDLPNVSQNVFNFGPQASFRYNFSNQSNLNLRYQGMTRQPQVFQLRPVPSNSNPSVVFLGNPKLKPEFTHSIHAHFSHFSSERHSNIHSSLQFDLTQNRIANVTIQNPDLFPDIPLDSAIFRPGGRINTFENVGLEYRGWGHFSYGIPLFERRLHLSISTSANIGNSKNIIDDRTNVINSLGVSQGLRMMYREERFHIGLNGHIGRTNTTFSLQPERNDVSNRTAAGADFSLHIIKDRLILSSDINYQTQTGMSVGFNPTSTIWNAQLIYTIGRNNNAQLLLRVSDILNNRQDTFRWTHDNAISDITLRNTLRRMFMVSFIYNKRQTG